MPSKKPLERPSHISEAEYRGLAAFRLALRRYLVFAELAAAKAGLPPQQYQALLAIKGMGSNDRPTVGLLAEHLLIAPHTALELVRRLEDAGHLRIESDPADRRRRLLALTQKSERILARLSFVHLRELQELAPGLAQLLTELSATGPR